MIRIQGEPGAAKGTIVFTARNDSRWAKPQEKDLIYGHSCKICGNVVQAFFYTDQPIDLRPYEWTAILSQAKEKFGDVLKFVPNQQDKGNYRTWFGRFGGRGVQKIVLKNHIIQLDKARIPRSNKEADVCETGERPCTHFGLFTLRPDLQIKDFLRLFVKPWGKDFARLKGLQDVLDSKPKESLASNYEITQLGNIQRVPAVGEAPDLFLIPRDKIEYFYYDGTVQTAVTTAANRLKESEAAA